MGSPSIIIIGLGILVSFLAFLCKSMFVEGIRRCFLSVAIVGSALLCSAIAFVCRLEFHACALLASDLICFGAAGCSVRLEIRDAPPPRGYVVNANCGSLGHEQLSC
ncbi:hypothetical protein BGZ57DRAFT_28381 [Hyaloscypha finlandica]|nr:hypothetical protein BGZ57DRAFT_28381 [Hyaloscypha finlandica]